MPWFVKTETFTEAAAAMPVEQRRCLIQAHQEWVECMKGQNHCLRSGFLVDEVSRPGGGGLLFFKAASYEQALAIVQKDPMIVSGLVEWRLHQWIQVAGDDVVDTGDATISSC